MIVPTRYQVLLALAALLMTGASQDDEVINRALTMFNRAKQLHSEGRLDEAIAEYKEASKLDSENPWIFNALGLAQTEARDFKEAEKAFRQALKLNAELTDVHNNLGVLYSEMGQKEKAFEEFTTVVRNPSYPTPEKALFNMGALYFREQNHELAQMYYRRAVEKSPKFAMGYRGLGEVHLALDEPEMAFDNFEKALELSPNDLPSLYEMARLYDQKGDTEKALEFYRRVVEVDRFSALGKISLERLETLKPGT
ncbi:MAG: tetratricopeptide repeat protein [Vicinamibacteria bacterium]